MRRRDRQRETEREWRETERETERQTDRDRDRQTDRQTDRRTDGRTDGQTDRPTDRQSSTPCFSCLLDWLSSEGTLATNSTSSLFHICTSGVLSFGWGERKTPTTHKVHERGGRRKKERER